jgi:hypothetical protein
MKKKIPAPNKSLEIRRAARELVSEGKPPRPRDIIDRLKSKGIEVLSSQVSTALRGTDLALRKTRPGRTFILPDPAHALRQVSVDDILKARKFAEEMGTLEKAAASIVALGQFGGSITPKTPRPPEENKDITQNKTFIAETQAAEQHRNQIHK